MAITKVGASLLFQKNTAGLPGFIAIIFKWYSEIERELIDDKGQASYMKFLNLLTLLVYFSLFLLGLLTLAQKLF
jgi:hypothetical protein